MKPLPLYLAIPSSFLAGLIFAALLAWCALS